MEFPSLQDTTERRRVRRHWARLGAYFLVGADSFSVNVQDYSQSGLFLSFERDIPPPERLAGWVGMAACIDVSK